MGGHSRVSRIAVKVNRGKGKVENPKKVGIVGIPNLFEDCIYFYTWLELYVSDGIRDRTCVYICVYVCMQVSRRNILLYLK